MTHAEYREKMLNPSPHNDFYVGKHEAKRMKVWRVLGPCGPTDEVWVNNLKEAAKSILGCWDYEIRDEQGNDNHAVCRRAGI